MPIKFGPDGYNSPNIRRFQVCQPPESSDGKFSARVLSRGLLRPLFAILIIALVLTAMLYLGRTPSTNSTQSAIGTVVSKDAATTANGVSRLRLEISIPLSPEDRQTVMIECTNETWSRFQRGDEVVAHFTRARGKQHITVTKIEPKPGTVEL